MNVNSWKGCPSDCPLGMVGRKYDLKLCIVYEFVSVWVCKICVWLTFVWYTCTYLKIVLRTLIRQLFAFICITRSFLCHLLVKSPKQWMLNHPNGMVEVWKDQVGCHPAKLGQRLPISDTTEKSLPSHGHRKGEEDLCEGEVERWKKVWRWLVVIVRSTLLLTGNR